VTPVNDEQLLATNNPLTLDRGSSAVITAAFLETTDIENAASELVYTVTSIPTHGALQVSGTPVTQFTQQQISAGLVSYQHDGTATLADSFGFSVDDGQGTTSSSTFQITIRPFAGDYDGNRTVDAADYVLWRKALGISGLPAFSGADGDGDGTIDQDDYVVWRANIGQTLPPPSVGSGMNSATSSVAPVAPVGVLIGVETSIRMSVSDPNQTADPLGASGAEEVASQRKNLRPIFAPASSLFARYRPAIRGSLRATLATAVSRCDEALVDWLASQPDTKKQCKESGTSETCASENARIADDIHIDSVEQVFALLASN
jgi:hypothetical protein